MMWYVCVRIAAIGLTVEIATSYWSNCCCFCSRLRCSTIQTWLSRCNWRCWVGVEEVVSLGSMRSLWPKVAWKSESWKVAPSLVVEHVAGPMEWRVIRCILDPMWWSQSIQISSNCWMSLAPCKRNWTVWCRRFRPMVFYVFVLGFKGKSMKFTQDERCIIIWIWVVLIDPIQSNLKQHVAGLSHRPRIVWQPWRHFVTWVRGRQEHHIRTLALPAPASWGPASISDPFVSWADKHSTVPAAVHCLSLSEEQVMELDSLRRSSLGMLLWECRRLFSDIWRFFVAMFTVSD